MDAYITGAVIHRLREEKQLTQAQLAERLGVSDKAVSKWETGRSYPDITLIEPLGRTLGVSAAELLSGCTVTNRNRSCNMKRLRLYVCPVCGNVIAASGEALVCCCGVTLPPAEPETPDAGHRPTVEIVEDEYYVTVPHDMSKEHFISFLAAVSDNGLQLVRLYPEGAAEARFKINRVSRLYLFCNRHGLFAVDFGGGRRPTAL